MCLRWKSRPTRQKKGGNFPIPFYTQPPKKNSSPPPNEPSPNPLPVNSTRLLTQRGFTQTLRKKYKYTAKGCARTQFSEKNVEYVSIGECQNTFSMRPSMHVYVVGKGTVAAFLFPSFLPWCVFADVEESKCKSPFLFPSFPVSVCCVHDSPGLIREGEEERQGVWKKGKEPHVAFTTFPPSSFCAG